MKTQLAPLPVVLIILLFFGCSKSTTTSKFSTNTIQGTWQNKDVKFTNKTGEKSKQVALMGFALALLAKPDFTFNEKAALKIYDPNEKNYRTCPYTM